MSKCIVCGKEHDLIMPVADPHGFCTIKQFIQAYTCEECSVKIREMIKEKEVIE